MKKTIYTLCVDNYAPQVTALTFPLMKELADKIRADFYVIDKRRYEHLPVTMEKLQIYDLARERHDEWAWFLDADTLVHPEMYDVTEMLPKDTVFHNGTDLASVRWTYDDYFRRDGRHLGSCNWCTGASHWCLDLWHPLEDLTLEEALSNIHITINEESSGFCQREHLIDDYALSRNIARYGLKVKTISQLSEQHRIQPYLWHRYAIPEAQKVREMLAVLSTPQQQPAFGESGTLLPQVPGAPPALRTPTGNIITACGIGWGVMNHNDLREYQEQFGLPAASADAPPGVYGQPVPNIPGWMTPEELQWLYEQGRRHRTIAEIGCWFGRSTHALLQGNWDEFGEDGCVYAVDHFKGSPSELETTHQFAKTGNVKEMFMNNCGKFKNLRICVGDSATVASENFDVDMVFLDGDHTFEAVYADLRAWMPNIRKPGLIAGHDSQYEGVQRALWKFFREPPHRAGETTIWWCPVSEV